MNPINLSILSPARNAYSETFIQAHKLLPFNISFYYDGQKPHCVEPEGSIVRHSIFRRVICKLDKRFSKDEHDFRASLKNKQINCVLAEYGTTAASVVKVVSSLNIPLIVHFHGYDASVYNVLDVYKEKYKQVFAYASYIVVVSLKMKQALLDIGCPEGKLILNHYGPNPSFFAISPQFVNAQFVAIGRFVDKKAPYLTIKAFKKMVTEFPDAKLVMGGDGPLLNACKNLVNVCGLAKNVEFKGSLTPSEVSSLFAESLAFVQHSITADDGDAEGTPVAILEAQAAGLPVISTIHAGIPEVVEHEITGFLTDELDVEMMGNFMLKLLYDKELARKMGAAGRNRMKNLFTLDKHLSTLEKLVIKACSNSGKI